MKGITFPKRDGAGLKIGIAVSRWNDHITRPLFDSCKKALLDAGVSEDDVQTVEIPGSFELPYACQTLVKKGCDAIVAIGCLIEGETDHYAYIAEGVTRALFDLQQQSNTPIVFGVLTCKTEEQAIERSTGKKAHGNAWGLSAVEMALLKRQTD